MPPRYSVRYDIEKAKKIKNLHDINRIILPFCVTSRKFDNQSIRADETAVFQALADDIQAHFVNKAITIVSCDTLQKYNYIIEMYIKYIQSDSSYTQGQLDLQPWATSEKWQEADRATIERGAKWIEHNKIIIDSLVGSDGKVKLAPVVTDWQSLDRVIPPHINTLIETAHHNNDQDLHDTVDKLAEKTANKTLSEAFGKNRSLHELCKPVVKKYCIQYLLDEAAKLYYWMDKYDTLFYPTEDALMLSLFKQVKLIAQDNQVNITLRLFEFKTIDEEKRQDKTKQKTVLEVAQTSPERKKQSERIGIAGHRNSTFAQFTALALNSAEADYKSKKLDQIQDINKPDTINLDREDILLALRFNRAKKRMPETIRKSLYNSAMTMFEPWTMEIEQEYTSSTSTSPASDNERMSDENTFISPLSSPQSQPDVDMLDDGMEPVSLQDSQDSRENASSLTMQFSLDQG